MRIYFFFLCVSGCVEKKAFQFCLHIPKCSIGRKTVSNEANHTFYSDNNMISHESL